MKPIFKKRELGLKIPDADISLGSSKEEVILEVLYLGEQCELGFEVGDKVLVDEKYLRTIKSLGKPFYRLDREDYVLCKIEI